MQRYDFHGHTVEEALAKINEVVSAIRLSGEPENVCFVTGHGVIKYEARELVENVYKLEIRDPLSSPSFNVYVE